MNRGPQWSLREFLGVCVTGSLWAQTSSSQKHTVKFGRKNAHVFAGNTVRRSVERLVEDSLGLGLYVRGLFRLSNNIV
jgi:hypothetical protein